MFETIPTNPMGSSIAAILAPLEEWAPSTTDLQLVVSKDHCPRMNISRDGDMTILKVEPFYLSSWLTIKPKSCNTVTILNIMDVVGRHIEIQLLLGLASHYVKGEGHIYLEVDERVEDYKKLLSYLSEFHIHIAQNLITLTLK